MSPFSEPGTRLSNICETEPTITFFLTEISQDPISQVQLAFDMDEVVPPDTRSWNEAYDYRRPGTFCRALWVLICLIWQTPGDSQVGWFLGQKTCSPRISSSYGCLSGGLTSSTSKVASDIGFSSLRKSISRMKWCFGNSFTSASDFPGSQGGADAGAVAGIRLMTILVDSWSNRF